MAEPVHLRPLLLAEPRALSDLAAQPPLLPLKAEDPPLFPGWLQPDALEFLLLVELPLLPVQPLPVFE